MVGHDEDPERPRVKVTDRRRLRPDGEVIASEAAPPAEDPGSPPAQAGGGQGAETKDVDTVRQEAGEYRDHLMRLQAEFENYRKRVLKEQTRAVEMASEPFVRRLLEVLDEFELALIAADRKPDFEKFLHGVELVYAKLQDVLRAEGVERIDAEGRRFDPSVHEALIHGGDGEGDLVVGDVLRQGYTMRGRVIRPAGVKVVHK